MMECVFYTIVQYLPLRCKRVDVNIVCFLGSLFSFGLFVKLIGSCFWAMLFHPAPLERNQQGLAGLSISPGEFFWLFLMSRVKTSDFNRRGLGGS